MKKDYLPAMVGWGITAALAVGVGIAALLPEGNPYEGRELLTSSLGATGFTAPSHESDQVLKLKGEHTVVSTGNIVKVPGVLWVEIETEGDRVWMSALSLKCAKECKELDFGLRQ